MKAQMCGNREVPLLIAYVNSALTNNDSSVMQGPHDYVTAVMQADIMYQMERDAAMKAKAEERSTPVLRVHSQHIL